MNLIKNVYLHFNNNSIKPIQMNNTNSNNNNNNNNNIKIH